MADAVSVRLLIDGERGCCPTSEFYGHAETLRGYAGVADGLPLRGRLQHGWTPTFSALIWDDAVARRGGFWAWSASVVDRLRDAGCETAQAIGAPFLYLPPLSDPTAGARGLLAVPTHSIKRSPVRGPGWSQWAAKVSTAAHAAGHRHWAVLLRPEDAGEAEVFAAHGFDVLAGKGLADPACLAFVRDALLAHAEVVSDRPCTALFYAAHLGRVARIVGPALQSARPDSAETCTADPDWVAQHFPGNVVTPWHARAELGADWMRPADDLRSMLWGYAVGGGAKEARA